MKKYQSIMDNISKNIDNNQLEYLNFFFNDPKSFEREYPNFSIINLFYYPDLPYYLEILFNKRLKGSYLIVSVIADLRNDEDNPHVQTYTVYPYCVIKNEKDLLRTSEVLVKNIILNSLEYKSENDTLFSTNYKIRFTYAFDNKFGNNSTKLSGVKLLKKYQLKQITKA